MLGTCRSLGIRVFYERKGIEPIPDPAPRKEADAPQYPLSIMGIGMVAYRSKRTFMNIAAADPRTRSAIGTPIDGSETVLCDGGDPRRRVSSGN